MQNPNESGFTPEQLTQSRLNEMEKLLGHIWNKVLPQMEGNFVHALTAAFLQNNALMIALRDKGLLTDDDMSAATEKAQAEMEKKQHEAEAARQAQQNQTEGNTVTPTGPKVVSPNDLEGLESTPDDTNEEK